jgi:hypothetical protein
VPADCRSAPGFSFAGELVSLEQTTDGWRRRSETNDAITAVSKFVDSSDIYSRREIEMNGPDHLRKITSQPLIPDISYDVKNVY